MYTSTLLTAHTHTLRIKSTQSFIHDGPWCVPDNVAALLNVVNI